MTLFATLVTASAVVSGTSARKVKIAVLGDALGATDPTEIAIAVGLLTGEVRQGRIGIGWATVRDIDVAAATDPSLTLHDLDERVTRLAATSGAGSKAAISDQLDELFRLATGPEADFLRRLFTGELRQGAQAGVLTEAIARATELPGPLVRRAAMLVGDLGLVATIAKVEGRSGVEAVGLTVLRAVQPMLASTSENVADALAVTGAASVEWKLDGARIQVHRRGGEVRVFTRNLNDITERVPEVVDATLGLDTTAVVLDGEALSLTEDGSPRPFQDTMSRFGTGGVPLGTTAMHPFFFDILHLDGTDLIDQPLRARKAALAALVGPLGIPSISTSDGDEAARFYEHAVAAGHEGVMVKALESAYSAGRRGKSWQKVKPVHTLDLVVLAVEWGSGRRRGWLSNIHLGARDNDRFVMVGKTFKGLTDDVLKWQTERFLELETTRTDNVVYVRPEQVVEIALDGAQRSTRYPGGVALRFARVRGYRFDKDAADADHIDAVRALLA